MKRSMDMKTQYIGAVAMATVFFAGGWEVWAQDSVVPGTTMRFRALQDQVAAAETAGPGTTMRFAGARGKSQATLPGPPQPGTTFRFAGSPGRAAGAGRGERVATLLAAQSGSVQ
jgi:hypothetical protein